jgi:hypothetical protein
MGDGAAVEMMRDELRADMADGVAAAVKRANVPALDDDEVANLLEIFASEARMTGGRRAPSSNTGTRPELPPKRGSYEGEQDVSGTVRPDGSGRHRR